MKSATRRTKMLRADSLEVRVAARGGRGIGHPSLTTTTLHAPAVATGVGGESLNLFSRSLASLGRPVCTRRGRREYPTCSLTLILHRRCGFARSEKGRQMHYLNEACEYSRHQNPGWVEEKSKCTT